MLSKKLKHLSKNLFSIEFFIIFLVVSIIVLTFFIYREVQIIHTNGILDKQGLSNEILINNKRTNKVSIRDIELINTWMTFRYINFIFNIPENYLKDKFQINDKGYPNLTIGRYIKIKKMDKTSFLNEVKNVVREYVSLHSLKNK